MRDKHIEIINGELVEKESTFEQAIEHLINRYSKENDSKTPDFILAQYLLSCLSAWNVGVQQRETWYGRNPCLSSTQSAKLDKEVGKE
jgi:hypothetical protein